MDNSIYNKALEAIIGEVGNFVEPSARMQIESYYANPFLHPISAYKARQTEDRFRDAAASMNLLEEKLEKAPVPVVFPEVGKAIENPTFEDKFKDAQRYKYDRAIDKHPLAYINGGSEKALEAEKRKVKYRRPKYY